MVCPPRAEPGAYLTFATQEGPDGTELRAEVRMLEQRRREATERLREVAALVQDVLPSREESLPNDLERRAARRPS